MSEDYPKEVTDAARRANEEHGDNIPAAVEQLCREVRGMPCYVKLRERFFWAAMQEVVHGIRHQNNRARINDAYHSGDGCPLPKVVVGNSPAVARVAKALVYMDHAIKGRTLGSIRGAELPAIAEEERLKAKGLMFNARLCDELRPLVKDDQRVEDALTEKELAAVFKRLKKRRPKAAVA